jgi:tungstate transport system substrate-binding protein
VRKRYAIAVLLLTLSAGCARHPQLLILATTTSVDNSGLLAELVPAFTTEAGVRMEVLRAGSGRALAMLEAGQADVVISHAPALEAEALSRHPAWWYRKIMFNDFVLAGPPSDPAQVRVFPTIEEAMKRIGTTGALFVSRGDESGTHERERQLWKAAGVDASKAKIVAAGQGMGTTLRIASEMRGYVLTDRATFMQVKPTLALEIVFEGGPDLLNTYAVVVPDRHVREGSSAMRFGRWLAEGRGRDIIAAFKVTGGIQAFAVWPPDSPRDRPDARPR